VIHDAAGEARNKAAAAMSAGVPLRRIEVSGIGRAVVRLVDSDVGQAIQDSFDGDPAFDACHGPPGQLCTPRAYATL
jgi:hypothetical protein